MRHTSDSGLENNLDDQDLDHDDHYHDTYNDHDHDHNNDNDHDHDKDESSSVAGSAPVKRKRLTQACDPCRKKKIKCDGIKPSCANCAKLDIHCTYLPSMKKRGPRQGYIELLEKRLDKMEKMLQHGPSALDAECLDSKRSGSEGESDTIDPSSSRSETSDVRFFGGTSALSHYSDIDKMAGRSMINNHGYAEGSVNNRSDLDTSLTKTKRPIYGIKDEIPRKDILDHLVQLFFDSVYFQFPIIHPESFMQQYKDGKISPNLLNAMCAGVARFSTHPDVLTTPTFLAGEPFASNVRASLVDSIDVPTVSNVQALLFLSMYEYGAARGPRAWMFGGMAIRMAQELGLNREDSSPTYYLKGDWVLRETRRRTFWACFTMDVLASSSSGRPRMIDERDCEVLLPSEDNAWHEARPVESEMLDNDQGGDDSFQEQQQSSVDKKSGADDAEMGNMTTPTPQPSSHAKEGKERQKAPCLSSFAYLVRILAVLGKVSQYVNRPRTKKSIPPNEPGSEFSIIDAALAAWLQSVPSHLKYSPENSRILNDKGEGCIIIFMHVIYHTSVVLLHRPILAADKASFPLDSNFVENSVARCADAATKVSDVLEFVSEQGYSPRIYISSFFAYPVFTTATIHITNAFASDPALASKARRNLSTHVKILQTMKSYWAMADKFFYIIRDLYSIQSKINSSAASGGIVVPQVVSHNAHGCSRDYAADTEVSALKAKGENPCRCFPHRDNATGDQGSAADAAVSRMVVNNKLASISSFLKSDSGLIALWRRATEMQVIDEANQQKKKIIMAKETSKPQHVGTQDNSEKALEEKKLLEQRNRMNELEIQEINQEFERQLKAKMLEERQQLKDGGDSQQESHEDEDSESPSQEKRQTDSEGLVNPRAPKQPKISKDSTSAVSQPRITSHQVSSNSSSGGVPSNNATWLGTEQSQHQSAVQPGSTLSAGLSYRHTLLQRPKQLQQNQGQDAYMLQPMVVQSPAPVTSSVNAATDVSQHLMQVYSQQHHQQEALSYTIDMRQNANIQQQQQRLQQQQQQAPVPSSLAFGPHDGFSSGYLSASSATVQQQQPLNPFQLQQQQPGMFSGPGYGPPLVYGTSYSHDQSSRARAEPNDSIFDFAMPLGDLNFLSSSFQMAPMMTQQSQSNEAIMESVNMVGSNPVSTSSLPSISVSSSSGLPSQSQSQSQPSGSVSLTTDLRSSTSAPNPETSTSSASLQLPGLEGQSPTTTSRGPSGSKSPPTTQNISPGLHSFMMSDDAFAEMHSSPDSLVRYLQLHHQQQLRQEMQFQQQDAQPLLNQQNSLIYDNYLQWTQFLPDSSGLAPGAVQPDKLPQQLSSINVDMDASMPARAPVHTSIPSFS
ncbi:hypothetical protein BGZ58_005281 [Dissophora ornata]|nr:hypothetical protein BGZ58_005281 [Dissophora ornata]